MKRNVLKALSLLCAVVFLVSAVVSVTYAWENEQQAVNNIYGTKTKFIDVELLKLEKQSNKTDVEVYIPNTAFYLFKSNGTQIGGRYLTDESGKISVSLPSGNYYFEEVSSEIGYTFDKDDNGNSITKYPFTVSEKDENVVVKAYNIRLKGDLLIRKTVKNTDDSPLTNIQKKTAFIFTVTFSDNNSYSYSIDNGEPKMLKRGETLELCNGQTAVFENLPVGVMYNVTEAPVEGYVCESTGHRGNITEKQSVADFVNNCNLDEMGSLTVHKTVTGNNADLNKQFAFIARIGDSIEKFSLKNGESKIFEGIPIGTDYLIIEEDTEGYIPSVGEYSGEIVSADNILLPFTNVCDFTPENKTGSLTVSKTVYGNNADPNREFTFTVNFDGENAPKTETFTLKAGESKTFKNLRSGIIYTVTETESNGYLPAINYASGVVAGEITVSTNFINVVSKEPTIEKTTKLTVTKHLDGELMESDKSKQFEMILSVNEKNTEFTLKANETKKFEIPIGAEYELQEKDYFSDGFSQNIIHGSGTATEKQINIIVTNTFVGEPKVEINGEKTWEIGKYKDDVLPDSITVQLKNGDVLLEEKTVSPNEKGLWKYSFTAPKYNSDGTEAEYTLTEIPITSYRASYSGYNIKNTYVAPIEVKVPKIIKEINGENPPETAFEFVFAGETGAPMPSDSENNKKRLVLVGDGELEVGTITFTKEGEYEYTVYEINGGEDGWIYDTSIYKIKFLVTESNNMLLCEETILKNNKVEKNILFSNVFDESQLGENITISGSKTWNHGDNPQENRPESIIVYVYGEGELVAQRLITQADNWQYSFKLPRFNSNGEKIVYTVDEANVENYSKQINGYDLVNTYVGKQNDQNVPGTTGDTPTTTGDKRQPPILWLVLMFVSLAVFVVTIILGKKQFVLKDNRIKPKK